MAAASTDLRLPGVYFLPPAAPVALGLPPLDVAAFVGFCERGPLHLPVAVEDVTGYGAVFGGDLALAPDQDSTILYATLPRSVAAFFENGGRRCYVVRVAGASATTARLRVPGLVSLSDQALSLASLSASSAGAWGAGLRLATLLQVTALPVA